MSSHQAEKNLEIFLFSSSWTNSKDHIVRIFSHITKGDKIIDGYTKDKDTGYVYVIFWGDMDCEWKLKANFWFWKGLSMGKYLMTMAPTYFKLAF